jgi:hypothetical protein
LFPTTIDRSIVGLETLLDMADMPTVRWGIVGEIHLTSTAIMTATDLLDSDR